MQNSRAFSPETALFHRNQILVAVEGSLRIEAGNDRRKNRS